MPLPSSEVVHPEQPAILLFGDSHSHAIHLAAARRKQTDRAVPVSVFRALKEKNGRKVGNIRFGEFLTRAGRLKRNDIVLSTLGGNRHAIVSTTQHPRPFDFFMPDHPVAPKDGLEIIPYQAIFAEFARGFAEGAGHKLRALRKTTSARVVHLIPPPPKADNRYIAHHHEKLFARQGLRRLGVSCPQLRLKFWLLQARVIQDFCRRAGVEVMLPPAEALSNGFLRREFYAEDTTHANWHYGELILRVIEENFVPACRVNH